MECHIAGGGCLLTGKIGRAARGIYHRTRSDTLLILDERRTVFISFDERGKERFLSSLTYCINVDQDLYHMMFF